MAYRRVDVAPAAAVEEARRGAVKGRFCRACGGVFPRYAASHRGKPIYGKDHVASPCSHEGDDFEPGASWWEPAVEILPAGEPES